MKEFKLHRAIGDLEELNQLMNLEMLEGWEIAGTVTVIRGSLSDTGNLWPNSGKLTVFTPMTREVEPA